MKTYDCTFPLAQMPDLLREAEARLPRRRAQSEASSRNAAKPPRRRRTNPAPINAAQLLNHLARSNALLARCRGTKGLDLVHLSARLLDATSLVVAKSFRAPGKAIAETFQPPAPQKAELNSLFSQNAPAQHAGDEEETPRRRKRVLIPPSLLAAAKLQATCLGEADRRRRKPGAPLGNQNAFKHGKFTRRRRALKAEIRAHIAGGRALMQDIPLPLKTAQNNYVAEHEMPQPNWGRNQCRPGLATATCPAEPWRSRKPKATCLVEAGRRRRKPGAPLGNRNAALKPEVAAHRAEAAAMMARARLALARLKLAVAAAKIAAQALPSKTTTVHEYREDGVLVRRITVQTGAKTMVTREIFETPQATRIRLCEAPQAVITPPCRARIESDAPAAPAPGPGSSWRGAAARPQSMRIVPCTDYQDLWRWRMWR